MIYLVCIRDKLIYIYSPFMYMWRSRVEHVCRVVYLWCTVCDSSLAVDHLLTRTGVSVPSHGPDVTTRSFAASVVASLVTCRHVVPNRTRHCHTNQLVGSSNLKATDREIKETGRKTHPRSGLHPPWSTHASFDPHSSFSHQIMGFIITE